MVRKSGYKTVHKGPYRSKAMASLMAARKVGYRPGTYNKSVARTRGPMAGRVETKYYECFKAAANLNAVTADWTNTEYDASSPAALCLFAPQAGTGYDQRIGRKVFVKSLKIRGQITFAMGTADSPTQVRYIVYMDTQTNGTQAQGEQVLGYGGTGAPAAANGINLMMNPANFGRFKILKDKTMTAADTNNNLASSAGQYRVLPLKCNIKVNTAVEFNAGNAGTVADIVNNSLHLIVMCNSNAGTPAIQYIARTSFTDN